MLHTSADLQGSSKLRWRLGAMGFSYPEWSGPFYPRTLKSIDYLHYYARRFSAVELDTTFYAVPKVEVVRRWRQVTPDDFRFAVKTPRAITHETPIASAIEPMREFLDVMAELGDRLGIVLLQYPPSLTVKAMPLIEAFLRELPKGVRYAIEFRDSSWLSSDAMKMLSTCRVAWTAVDYDVMPAEVRATCDNLYIRWIGAHGRYPDGSYEREPMTDRLRGWENAIRAAMTDGTVWGFFNNDFAGNSIASCRRFAEIVGVKLPIPPDGQMELFPK